MILHFRMGNIEVEKCDYIIVSVSKAYFKSRDETKLPYGGYYSPCISMKLLSKMKKEEMIRPVNKDQGIQYYQFTKKAFFYDGIYKLK